MASYVPPKRATALRFSLSLFARSDNQIKTAPTLAAGDVKVSKDFGATANIATLPVETPASSGILQVDLSGTEMTADVVTLIFRDAAGAEWNDVSVHIATVARQIDDLAFPNTSGRGLDVSTDGDTEANVTKWLGTAAATPTVAGVPEVDVTHWLGTAAATPTVAGVPEVDVTHWEGGTDTVTGLSLFEDSQFRGVADSGTTTTIVDAALTQANTDQFKDSLLVILSGAMARMCRTITAFTPGTDTLTFTPALPSGITTETYLILPRNLAWPADWDAEVQSEATDALNAYDPPTRAELTSDINSVLTPIGVIDDFLDLEVAAIKAKTDQLTFGTANRVDAQVFGIEAGAVSAAAIANGAIDAATFAAGAIDAASLAADAGTEIATAVWASGTRVLTANTNLNDPSAAAVADAVWDEVLAGHAGAGSAGEALAAAGTAGDPWTTALPGAYGAGTAGKIVGDNINATVSSRATQTSVDDLPTNAELATSQAAADDATLAAIAALNDVSVADILTTQMTEAYAADGSAPTLAQSLFLIQQYLGDFTISGTTLTVKKIDGSTTAATFTLNDGTNPTGVTRTA
jgi:hypothetical protein